MKVAIVGCGYVGLVTGACLAERGQEVICVDVDLDRVSTINAGSSPIHEPGLDELISSNAGMGLRATEDLRAAILESEVSLIAVGTPFTGDTIDLRSVKDAAGQIGRALRDRRDYHVVAVKSTVVPGTTDGVVLPILEEASGRVAGRDFGVGANPEFLTEGSAVQEFMEPDRIVLGGVDERAIDALDHLYDGFDGTPRLRTNNRTAEMVKYASNALLATCISFSNEIANLCTSFGDIDAADVMRGIQGSRYLTPVLPGGDRLTAPLAAFLWPGCGFGGSCLPKDLRALVAWGAGLGRELPLLRAVIQINERRPEEVLGLLRRHVPNLQGARVAILGLAFKPDTDDVRESPAIPVVKALLDQGAQIRIYDPVAYRAAPRLFPCADVWATDDLTAALSDVDAAIVVTRWPQLDEVPGLLASAGNPPLLVDGRRMLDKRAIARYEGVGL